MKTEATIRDQLRQIEEIANADDTPQRTVKDANVVYHALAWVLIDQKFSPAEVLEKSRAMGGK